MMLEKCRRCNAIISTGPHPHICEHDAFARVSDPPESKQAAARTNVGKGEREVLDALAFLGPSTTREIAEYTNVHLVSISPRLKPLEKKGRVARTDKRRQGRMIWRLLFND